MPILCTTPYNPGDNDKDAKDGYPYCQILSFHQNAITFGVVVEYAFGFCHGTFLEKWEKGKGSPVKTLDVDPATVARLWGQEAHEGETVGAAMRRLTYAFLIESGKVDGEIMDNPPLPPVSGDADEQAGEDVEAEPEPETATPEPAEEDAASGEDDDAKAAEPAEPVPSPS